jgi:LysR family hydrogen peroxide-inducible transcriptional activator
VDRAQGGLTEDGARVVDRARRVLNEIDDITADMASDGPDVSGQSRLGIIGTTARWLMPQLLAHLEVEHPHLRAVVQEGATSTLIPNVISGQLNAAIVHLPVDDPELAIDPLFAEDLFLLAGADHPLAEHDQLSLADLDDVPLLLPPTGAALRRVLDRAANAAGATLRAQAEVDGVRLLASLALDGYGATIVPATAVPTWLTGSFRRITVPELPRRVVAFVSRRRPSPSAATLAVLRSLHTIVDSAAENQPGVHRDTNPFSRQS